MKERKPRTEPVTIKVSVETILILEALAARKQITRSTLVSNWIDEKIRQSKIAKAVYGR
jgi:hypothetical protein